MHISDLHFHRLPRHPSAYLSKRALGAMNLLLRRWREFPLERARGLVKRLEKASWHHLVISGDLTQLGTHAEFALAREVLAPLLARGTEQVTVIPGNHDKYVAEAEGRSAFEAHFGEFCRAAPASPQQLAGNWWLAAWDSAQPAPWNSAEGRVTAETLLATETWLAGRPSGSQLIVANHYPVFFPSGHSQAPAHGLVNHDTVRAWLLNHPVRLYLHGHVHQNWVLTVEGSHGPLTVVNSAASTARPGGAGVSSFHRIVLDGDELRVEPQQLE
ncbi:MAG: metallophosphoesterase [bacterium]